ncbi:MAG: hypothetical protein K0U79_18780 [Gammaproteobacteria bacterium]|nr:hypothetical protein [Gammaproteobacteria bacterium]
MSRPYLSIDRLTRKLAAGGSEELKFLPGVNVFVGRPNTGKTQWLRTLDYLLGDPDENPFAGAEDAGLADKYDSAGVELVLGEERVWVERRWREAGAKTKIFVGDEGMTPTEFRHWLMAKLGMPIVNFPKGNPMSGQTWPELSFRTLLRHIYRQQRFWTGLADKQTESEQHASLLQFLGLAERIFTPEFGKLIELKMKVEQLKARRDQYGQTLDELAQGVLSEPDRTVGLSEATIEIANRRIVEQIGALRERRNGHLTQVRDRTLSAPQRGRAEELSETRAQALALLEELQRKQQSAVERSTELESYRSGLAKELDRITRAEEAGEVFADLKITHCPACDQPVAEVALPSDECFLCHQSLPDEPMIQELGAVRLRFESGRLNSEMREAEDLIGVLRRDTKKLMASIASTNEQLHRLEAELAPARQAVAALAQEEVSAIDMELGELSERQRQLGRIASALQVGNALTEQIAELERQIAPLQGQVDEAMRGTDFEAAAEQLADGMNAYLTAINVLRPGAWVHSPVFVDITRSSVTMRVGSRRWDKALGGTDSLYFLMAYHYGLMSLSHRPSSHYPGLSIIDVPGEFAGEAVADKENFIVQPFIDLLSRDEYHGAQLIITGASFAGLADAHRQLLTEVYVA